MLRLRAARGRTYAVMRVAVRTPIISRVIRTREILPGNVGVADKNDDVKVLSLNVNLGTVGIDKSEVTALDADTVNSTCGNTVKDCESGVMLSKSGADIGH
jgi:hypothetical protein